MRCGNGRIGGAVLGAALAGLACWVAAGAGTAEEPTVKVKPKNKDTKSAGAARAQLADQLALTPMQRAAWARSNEELDAVRAGLLTGLDKKLADMRKLLTDDAASADDRRAAVERIDDIHQAFRKVEAERKSRLEELLSADQKRKLEELSHPAAGEGPVMREGLAERITRSVRRLGLTEEKNGEVRRHRESLDRSLTEAEHLRQTALDEFHRSVAAVIKDDPQRAAEWEGQRAEWEKPRKGKPAGGANKPGDKPGNEKTPAAKQPGETAPAKP